MNPSSLILGAADEPFQIRFESLFNPGRALAFPCDAAGNVPLDAMPQRARNNYLFARAMIGRDFAAPCVVRAGR
jgi:hypothetical protein